MISSLPKRIPIATKSFGEMVNSAPSVLSNTEPFIPFSTMIESATPDHALLRSRLKLLLVVQTRLRRSPPPNFLIQLGEVKLPSRIVCSEDTRVTLEAVLPPELNSHPGLSFVTIHGQGSSGWEKSSDFPLFFVPPQPVSVSLSCGIFYCVDLQWLKTFQFAIRTLDISSNKLTDLHSLDGFTSLTELVANNNLLSDITRFPQLPELRALHLSGKICQQMSKHTYF